jgi:hypothetical protein
MVCEQIYPLKHNKTYEVCSYGKFTCFLNLPSLAPWEKPKLTLPRPMVDADQVNRLIA